MRSTRWTSVVVLHDFSYFPSTNGGVVVATLVNGEAHGGRQYWGGD
jgi:hypothetical protein